MTGARILGLCADDYGMDSGICRAILELVRSGRLSAVSCLSGGPAWAELGPELAAEPAVVDGRVRIGLHFNLTEGRPLSAALAARWPAFPRLPALIVRAHLRACGHDELPPAPARVDGVRGTEIVFARQALRIDDAMAEQIARREGARDLPCAGTQFAAGDPLCSFVAEGRDVHEVTTRLASRRDALLESLETRT